MSISFSYVHDVIYMNAKKNLCPDLSSCLYVHRYIFLSLSIFAFLCISCYRFESLWNCSYICIYAFIYIYVYISIIACSWVYIVKRGFLICIDVYI